VRRDEAPIEALDFGAQRDFPGLAQSVERDAQGQLQLLSIARAVAANPRILLLDEITANLDSATEEKVLEALRAASTNRTVISISHRLYEQRGGREICLAK